MGTKRWVEKGEGDIQEWTLEQEQEWLILSHLENWYVVNGIQSIYLALQKGQNPRLFVHRLPSFALWLFDSLI